MNNSPGYREASKPEPVAEKRSAWRPHPIVYGVALIAIGIVGLDAAFLLWHPWEQVLTANLFVGGVVAVIGGVAWTAHKSGL